MAMDLEENTFVHILLVLCFIMRVFGDPLQQDLDILREKSVAQINTIVNPLLSTIQSKIETAEEEGISTGDESACPERSIIACFKGYINCGVSMLDECCKKAAKDQNFQYAQICCSQTVAALQKEAESYYDYVIECIENMRL